MTTPLTHSESIHIAASPKDVYAVVSDVTRTGEWSPVCKECWWDEGDGPHVGAHFTGKNVTPDRTWETNSVITDAEEGVAFGWKVGKGTATWRYTMEPADDGTELTEHWEFTSFGQDWFVERYGAEDAPAEVQKRVEAARDGIHTTLTAMKRIIEAA